MQVVVHVDGFTQFCHVDVVEEAQEVYTVLDEVLENYTRQTVGDATNTTKFQKHYYYAITIPGVGCFVVAMKSGSRCMPGTLPPDFHFWTDLLVDEGFATEEEAAQLRNTVWKVR